MLNSTNFKVLHWIATILMALVIAIYCYFQHVQRITVRDQLYEVRQLTPRTWLYITQYKDSNMTTGEVYRYFLASKLEGDPLVALEKQHIAPYANCEHLARKKWTVSAITSRLLFTVLYMTSCRLHFFMMQKGSPFRHL
ncbi:Uncharacterised protein [Leclercia adecarboxylata]|uniref:Uncharacterized protein n=1 Tax=Leclercia adecarboxylata TaxID=83655 RepID=A0A4U9IFW9_9ENTR|nr:Uncharacterised protein [Leclercia adecarboxylata]